MASRATVISGPSALSFMPLVRCSGGVTSARKTRRQSTSPARPAARRPRRESCWGNPRRRRAAGSRPKAASAPARCRCRVLSRMASGVRRSEANPARPMPRTGEQQHRRDHLAAGNARRAHGHDLAIAAMPAQPDQNAHQHAERNGQRQHRRERQQRTARPRCRGLALLPTSTSNSWSSSCRKMTNVASSVPSTALVRIFAEYVAAEQAQYRPRLARHLRRRHHRQLGLLLLHRVQLQIVDQNRRRHHAGLGGETGAPRPARTARCCP